MCQPPLEPTMWGRKQWRDHSTGMKAPAFQFQLFHSSWHSRQGLNREAKGKTRPFGTRWKGELGKQKLSDAVLQGSLESQPVKTMNTHKRLVTASSLQKYCENLQLKSYHKPASRGKQVLQPESYQLIFAGNKLCNFQFPYLIFGLLYAPNNYPPHV